jgi:hypothetical protein
MTAIAVISNIIPVTAKFETVTVVFAGKFPSGRLTEKGCASAAHPLRYSSISFPSWSARRAK